MRAPRILTSLAVPALALATIVPTAASATGKAPTHATTDAAPVEAVKLQPVGGSKVTGRATYQAKGAGTVVTVHLTGLGARTTFRAHLNAGTCEAPSASTTAIATGRADAKGTARATGAVRFRGEPLPISVVADGEHLVSVVAGGKMVACAVLPGLS